MYEEELTYGPNSLAKYGPLLKLLEHGEDDWEFLASQPNYSSKIGRAWRRSHCRAVQGYMRAIRTDFEVSVATNFRGGGSRCAWLGHWLGNTERQLRRLERKVRFYIFIQNIVPVPGRRSIAIRRSLLARVPMVGASEFREMFVEMLHIHRRGGATVDLP